MAVNNDRTPMNTLFVSAFLKDVFTLRAIAHYSAVQRIVRATIQRITSHCLQLLFLKSDITVSTELEFTLRCLYMRRVVELVAATLGVLHCAT